MGRGKKAATFFLTAAALVLLLYFYANDTVTDWIKCAVNGSGNAEYYELTAATDGSVWALGRRGEDYVLTCGTLGGSEWRGRLNTGALPDTFLPDDIYAVSKDVALLSGYRLNKDGTPSELHLYAVSDQGKKVTALLSKDVAAGTGQGSRLKFSTFSRYQDEVFFLLSDGEVTNLYELAVENMNLRMTGSFSCEPWNSALILSNGKIAVARENGIIAFYSNFGVHQYDLDTNGSVSALYAGTESFYYLDAVSKTVNEVGELNDEYYVIQIIPADNNLPLTVQPGGTTIWLENGQLFHYDGAPVRIDGILYRAPREGLVILAGCLAAVIVLAVLAAVVFCGKKQISLLVRAAFIMVFTLLIFIGAMRLCARQESQQTALNQARQGVETAASLGLELSQELGDETVSDETAQYILRAMADSGFYDTRVTLYRYAEHGFYVVTTTDPELENDTVVVGHGLLLKAQPDGTISALGEELGGPVCMAVASDGPYLLYVQTNFTSVREQGQAQAQKLITLLATALVVFAGIIYLLLLRIWNGIYRMTLGMNLVSAGEYDVELKNPSGDELEGLAKAMNNMTESLRENREKGKKIDENYMRFIPEETIRLMGVERLEDVTRETVANHTMAVMTVRFTLPEENISTEQLFSDINTVIQRTIFAAVAYAGNSFNFTHDGYNVVFPEEFVEMSFHAALAIREAADAVNKEREFAGRAPVRLCIAMDRGLVQMGIVGDELHMVPAAVSRCLEKNEQMLRLCRTLDASILFTESMVPFGDDCNSRYVGNFASISGVERLYELYEGDSYLIAQRKHEIQEEFDRAIQLFYQRNFTAAKAILLQLVRTGSARDGGVCYYLNKADLYEQHPPQSLLLHGEEY